MHSFVIMMMGKMQHCSVGSKLRAEMKQQRWGLSSSGWCLMLPEHAVFPCRCLGKAVPQPTLSVSGSSFCPRQPAGQDPSGQSASQSDQSHVSSAWIIIVVFFLFRLLLQAPVSETEECKWLEENLNTSEIQWPDSFKIVFHLRNRNWKEIKSPWLDVLTLFVCVHLYFYSLLINSAYYTWSVSHVAIFSPAGGWAGVSLEAPWWRTLTVFFSLHGLPASAWGINRGDARRHRDRRGQRGTGNQIWGRQEAACPGAPFGKTDIYIINWWAGTHRCLFLTHSPTYTSQSNDWCNVLK